MSNYKKFGNKFISGGFDRRKSRLHDEIGSNLGGIAELVKHNVDGLLVEPDSVEAWGQAIERCYQDKTLLERMRTGVRPPRSMDTVAQEMISLYEHTNRMHGQYSCHLPEPEKKGRPLDDTACVNCDA